MSDLVNEERTTASAKEWTARILTLRRKHKVQPSKAQMGRLYDEMLAASTIPERHPAFEAFVRQRQTRSLSGIAVIAVMMSPYPQYQDPVTGELKQQRFSCAKNCYFCPNEPGMPRSYLPEEAAVARAARASFDAIQQFYGRANTLTKLGHAVDKIELSVLGGTFSQYPRDYQEEFLRDLFWSANTFNDGIALFSGKRARRSLAEEIKIHETHAGGADGKQCRIVGLTLETRPDTIHDFAAVRRLRELGATRLQIGVQHTDDAVLAKINRGCAHADTVRCIRLLKNAGYKIDIHLMPNLPGSSPDKDKRMFAEVLEGDLLQADQWKVYPCQTVKHTVIAKWHAQGSYVPYSYEALMEVVVGLKAAIPPWIRLNRIFRALPAEDIVEGITQSNFRQVLACEMKRRSLRCRCIRCREVGTLVRKGTFSQRATEAAAIQLRVRQYMSSGGREYFISLESEDETVLVGFVRLRLPACLLRDGTWHPKDFSLDEARYGSRAEYETFADVFPELYHAALVREAHVYGFKVTQMHDGKDKKKCDTDQTMSAQSRGYGTLLMTEAEKIAQREGYARVAVIAGVGVRKYYRAKLGYRIDGTYMVKDLNNEDVKVMEPGEAGEPYVPFEDEERIVAEVGGDAGAVRRRQTEYLKQVLRLAAMLIACTFIAAQVVSILSALFITVCYLGVLNYALFWSVPFDSADRYNKGMLLLSRASLLLLDTAVLGKMGSTVGPPPSLFTAWWPEALQPWSWADGCTCASFWQLSLASYVTAIYIIKLLYYKRASLMMQDPMVANGSGKRGPSCTVQVVMCSLVVVFLACEFMVINLTDSGCTDGGLGAACRDTFAPINTWFAIAAIGFDLAVLVNFMVRWNAFLSMFAEETAGHMMTQFLLVSLVMLSCVWNACCHLTIVYFSESPEHVDSFQGSPAFLLDVCVMATCVVLAFVDAQETMCSYCEMPALKAAHAKLKAFSHQMRVATFGAHQHHASVHDASYEMEDEEP